MPKPGNRYEEMARDAAARIDDQRALGEQLALPGVAEEDEGDVDRKGGRGRGKAVSQLRRWLEDKGYVLPEEKLVQMAGLASRDDAILTAMAAAERVLTWAFDVDPDEMPAKTPKAPTPAKRLEVFMQLYTVQLRALDALMPYGAPKASPDVQVTQQTTIVVPAAPARPGDSAKVVNGSKGPRMTPPPLPHEMQQKQRVDRDGGEGSDE